ncbi:MAG: metallophosphoesterase [Ktedonobacterales bacterium]
MSGTPTIVVTSDLHLGITKEAPLRQLAERIETEQPTLTVLAGDIGEGIQNFRACLSLFSRLPGTVAVLAGNHDVWARGHHSQDLWERHLPEAVRDAGMLWLEDDSWQQGGVAVVGSIAWYDYSAVDPNVPPHPPEYFATQKRHYNMDAMYIDWPSTDGEFATRVGDALCARLTRLESESDISSIIAVTHVPLFDAQMARKPADRRWGFSNAYFGNLTLGQRILQSKKLRAVVSGHTHVGRSGTVTRPDAPDLPPIPISVLASDYNNPVYQVVIVPQSQQDVE